MKITQPKLKEMVRQIVRKKLSEMNLNERDVAPGTEGADDPRMNKDAVAKHLELEKEKTRQKRNLQKRHSMKRTTRGMELECGPGSRDDEGEEMSNDGDEEYLSRLEKLVLQSEKKRQN